MKKSLLRFVLFSGLLVGVFDILMAFASAYIKNGVTPDRVLRFVASGVFGKKAFAPSETGMIAYGLLFHFLIAMIFTVLFYIIYPKIKWLSVNRILTGILYGLLVWVVMNQIIVPLSNTPPIKFQLKNALTGMAILIIAIGLPLSFLANNYFEKRKQ